MVFQLKILDSKRQAGPGLGHVRFYRIEVTDNDGKRYVKRRYNDFMRLDGLVCSEGLLPRARLPPKGLLGLRQYFNIGTFNQQRFRGLNNYLRFLARQLDVAAASDAMEAFVSLDTDGSHWTERMKPRHLEPSDPVVETQPPSDTSGRGLESLWDNSPSRGTSRLRKSASAGCMLSVQLGAGRAPGLSTTTEEVDDRGADGCRASTKGRSGTRIRGPVTLQLEPRCYASEFEGPLWLEFQHSQPELSRCLQRTTIVCADRRRFDNDAEEAFNALRGTLLRNRTLSQPSSRRVKTMPAAPICGSLGAEADALLSAPSTLAPSAASDDHTQGASVCETATSAERQYDRLESDQASPRIFSFSRQDSRLVTSESGDPEAAELTEAAGTNREDMEDDTSQTQAERSCRGDVSQDDRMEAASQCTGVSRCESLPPNADLPLQPCSILDEAPAKEGVWEFLLVLAARRPILRSRAKEVCSILEANVSWRDALEAREDLLLAWQQVFGSYSRQAV